MSLNPEPDERRAEFEDLVARLKKYEAEGANVKGGKLATDEAIDPTDELFEGLTPGEAMFQVAMVRKALRAVPPEVWNVVPLALALDGKEPGTVAYDMARGNFSMGLRHELRDPGALAKALGTLHLIRQEVNRGK